MAIHYDCRHCGNSVGKLEMPSIHAEKLGIHKLSNEERQNMVSYTSEGHVKIQTICEDCQESLERNPDYHELDQFIQ
ncbi:anti-sigma-F factor Fin family protein [Jeotgalibacillus soli]|uniref:anti-sigma-F factor Fin family protein n=1 Tax=Jeotgalibacillus soli TaxID=889306 RepID=UPI000596DD9C|nr:anti-sigma-F factor Fin family protein [Jeotgalibacillus soli]